MRTVLSTSNRRKAAFITAMDPKTREEYLSEELIEMRDSDPRHKFVL